MLFILVFMILFSSIRSLIIFACCLLSCFSLDISFDIWLMFLFVSWHVFLFSLTSFTIGNIVSLNSSSIAEEISKGYQQAFSDILRYSFVFTLSFIHTYTVWAHRTQLIYSIYSAKLHNNNNTVIIK